MSQDVIVGPVNNSGGYTLKKAASTLRSAMDAALRTAGADGCAVRLSRAVGAAPGPFGFRPRAGHVRDPAVDEPPAPRLGAPRPAYPAGRPDRGKVLPTQLTAAGRAQLEAASEAVRAVGMRMLTILTAAAERRLCQDLTLCVAGLGEPVHA